MENGTPNVTYMRAQLIAAQWINFWMTQIIHLDLHSLNINVKSQNLKISSPAVKWSQNERFFKNRTNMTTC